ncbi:hypothetical protein O0I10_006041 [Lichtheimia ornata]|uniref:VPS37 C-terminal domain-containing protein n=1 Tax=Lichtheimia ornata TaxID=688661 RepID=A0AAD7XZ96_9FUNG|nr:uncharacterized protein O0I10_006041 [Lichtheimia ornata]KAJ8658356.1 hypothetical protein O0I10_006041 [Lichtheimia ornata]
MSTFQEVKQQQIASLYSHNPAVTTIIEGQMYELPCPMGNVSAALLVNLPPEFPDVPPIITVSPTGMRHPWIESDVVVHDALHWNASQVQLGKWVHDIIEEFTQRPPARKGGSGANGEGPASAEEGYGHRPPPPIPSNTSAPSATPLALSMAEYTSIVSRSMDELEELLSNDVAFELFFNSLERVQNMKTVQEELRNGNVNLANKNLTQESSLQQLRDQVKELDGEYRQLRAQFEEKEKQQNDAFNRFSPATMMTRLKASIHESDELSESVAQSFLDGNLDHDGFVKQFRELRKVYHIRASKLERSQKETLSYSI